MSDMPKINFRKLGYTEEKELSKLYLKQQQLLLTMQRTALNGDFDAKMEEMEGIEERVLDIILRMVEHLPESYLREGVDPKTVEYGKPDKVLEVLAFAAFERLSKFAITERESLTKNS